MPREIQDILGSTPKFPITANTGWLALRLGNKTNVVATWLVTCYGIPKNKLTDYIDVSDDGGATYLRVTAGSAYFWPVKGDHTTTPAKTNIWVRANRSGVTGQAALALEEALTS